MECCQLVKYCLHFTLMSMYTCMCALKHSNYREGEITEAKEPSRLSLSLSCPLSLSTLYTSKCLLGIFCLFLPLPFYNFTFYIFLCHGSLLDNTFFSLCRNFYFSLFKSLIFLLPLFLSLNF